MLCNLCKLLSLEVFKFNFLLKFSYPILILKLNFVCPSEITDALNWINKKAIVNH